MRRCLSSRVFLLGLLVLVAAVAVVKPQDDHQEMTEMDANAAVDTEAQRIDTSETLGDVNQQDFTNDHDEEGVKSGHHEGIANDRNEVVESDHNEGIESNQNEGVKDNQSEGVESNQNEGVESNHNEDVESTYQDGVEADHNEKTDTEKMESVVENSSSDNEDILKEVLLDHESTFGNNEEASEEYRVPDAEKRTRVSGDKDNKEETTDEDDGFDVDSEDWGTYYDPQNVFCGKYDCYKILGFDYESFGKVKPSAKEITKRYRKLSRVWHPDKSKHKNAKARFVHIARAYEILTTKAKRGEYDFMRYNQEAYFRKYGTNVLWSYAPKTDTVVVVVFLLIIGNIISWFLQKHRWQLVANRLIKAAVEDWSPREGGTLESKHLREEALTILSKKTESEETTALSKSKKKRLTTRERKMEEQEALRPIITELVYAMDDFGGGFHKPTHQDLLIVTMFKMPYNAALGTLWQLQFWLRRVQSIELDDEERMVLTERAVGPVIWGTLLEEERMALVKRELWVKGNFLEWQEERELKKLSATEQKQYLKMKKQGKVD